MHDLFAESFAPHLAVLSLGSALDVSAVDELAGPRRVAAALTPHQIAHVQLLARHHARRDVIKYGVTVGDG